MVQQIIFVFAVVFVVLAFYLVYRVVIKPAPVNKKILDEPFPEKWREILQQRVLYYKNLPPDRKAEFLAVVSEYFFDNPEKLKQRHPELYRYLTDIFRQKPDDYV